jgi:hypothetical protein
MYFSWFLLSFAYLKSLSTLILGNDNKQKSYPHVWLNKTLEPNTGSASMWAVNIVLGVLICVKPIKLITLWSKLVYMNLIFCCVRVHELVMHESVPVSLSSHGKGRPVYCNNNSKEKCQVSFEMFKLLFV